MVVDFVRQRNVSDLNIFVAPFVEELDGPDLSGDILGQDSVTRDGHFDFDLAVVRHLDDLLGVVGRKGNGPLCCDRLRCLREISWVQCLCGINLVPSLAARQDRHVRCL